MYSAPRLDRWQAADSEGIFTCQILGLRWPPRGGLSVSKSVLTCWFFARLEIPTCPFEESAVREDGCSVA